MQRNLGGWRIISKHGTERPEKKSQDIVKTTYYDTQMLPSTRGEALKKIIRDGKEPVAKGRKYIGGKTCRLFCVMEVVGGGVTVEKS